MHTMQYCEALCFYRDCGMDLPEPMMLLNIAEDNGIVDHRRTSSQHRNNSKIHNTTPHVFRNSHHHQQQHELPGRHCQDHRQALSSATSRSRILKPTYHAKPQTIVQKNRASGQSIHKNLAYTRSWPTSTHCPLGPLGPLEAPSVPVSTPIICTASQHPQIIQDNHNAISSVSNPEATVPSSTMYEIPERPAALMAGLSSAQVRRSQNQNQNHHQPSDLSMLQRQQIGAMSLPNYLEDGCLGHWLPEELILKSSVAPVAFPPGSFLLNTEYGVRDGPTSLISSQGLVDLSTTLDDWSLDTPSNKTPSRIIELESDNSSSEEGENASSHSSNIYPELEEKSRRNPFSAGSPLVLKERLSSEPTSSSPTTNGDDHNEHATHSARVGRYLDDSTLPYAQLIYKALMSVPDRRMVLGQIYQYFQEQWPRFRKAKGRGWMNSIRHNLSMNGAFLKEDRPDGDQGKGYVWVLAEGAALDGVKSTTRYRKNGPASTRKRCAPHDSYLDYAEPKRTRRSKKKIQPTIVEPSSPPVKQEIPAIQEHIISPPSPVLSNSETIPDEYQVLTPDFGNTYFNDATISTSFALEDEFVFGSAVIPSYEYSNAPFCSSFTINNMRDKQYDGDDELDQASSVGLSLSSGWQI